MEGKHIDAYEALFELDKLVDDSRLTKQERINQKLNIQALRQIVGEWEGLRHGKENK